MSNNWANRSIESLCLRVRSGGTPSRKRPEYFVEPNHAGAMPWLKTKELNDTYLHATEEFITRAAIAASSAKVLPQDTVVMAMYGATVGKLGILATEMTCNQAVCAMEVDPSQADPRFLFYRLLQDRPRLVGLATGSAQQNLSGTVIRNFKVACPPLDEQRRIAGVLGALDDLIEVNRRLMSELDELGLALFRNAWDGQTWCSVSDLGTVTMGQSPPGSTYNEEGLGLVFYQGVRDFGSRYPTPRVHCTAATRKAAAGDILIAVRAPIGETNVAVEPTAIGRGLAALKASRPALTLRALRATSLTWSVHEGNGTVFSSISGPDLRAAKVPSVTDDVLEVHLSTLDQAHLALAQEAAELEATRNELLPLLMSGRVRVGDVAA